MKREIEKDSIENADTLHPTNLPKTAPVNWTDQLKGDLNKAANAQTQDHSYKSVAALLLGWDDDATDLKEVKNEITLLKETFEKNYGFAVTTYMIPGDKGNPFYKLEMPLAEFLDHAGNLLIIYYGK